MSWAGILLGLGLLVFAIWIFGRTLRQYDPAEVIHRLGQIQLPRLILAVGCVALSYLFQAGYEYLALATLNRPPRFRQAALAAFVSNALTNNMGLSLVTGTSVRYRFYRAWGYGPLEIAQVITLSKLAFFNGLLVAGGLSQIIHPIPLPQGFFLPLSPRIIGWLLLAPAALLLVWNGVSGSTLKLGRASIPRPEQRILVLQILICGMHLVFSAFTLYLLIPPEALRQAGMHNPLVFMCAFLAVKCIAMLFPVPGNLGVLEGTAVALLTPALAAYPLLGALLAYRLGYYVLPFALALIILAGYELASKKGLRASFFSKRRGRTSI